ncbi:hypothetical protein E8E13_002905 [Curvularia kusanoi]|uniref:Uncharacterized protein n=1 Tax=Curvularia kusanoi TaxID=90978 RepID=A0A9P4T4F8_CURKU|nr:hypothetical protein E8E13_002905 [Curvularia kusanoi]
MSVGPAEIGHIKNATLTIRGPTLSLRVKFEDDDYEFCILGPPAVFKNSTILAYLDYQFAADYIVNGDHKFLALFMGSGGFLPLTGLILRQTGVVYERIGVFGMTVSASGAKGEVSKKHIASLPVTTVQII